MTSTADALLETLSNRTRRELCRYFLDASSPVAEREELVTYLLEGDATADDRDAVATSLVHTHLPALDALAVVDYDERNGTVRYRGHPLLEAVLATVETHEAGADGTTPETPAEFRSALGSLLADAHGNDVPVTGFWTCQADRCWEVHVVPVDSTPETSSQ